MKSVGARDEEVPSMYEVEGTQGGSWSEDLE